MTAGTNSGVSGLLIETILDPKKLMQVDARRWELLLSCARRNAVLAYLAQRAAASGVLDALPERPRLALISARTAAARLAQLARWELNRVWRALRPLNVPIIALKGVAYIIRDMPHGDTRLLSDIDIMVPRDRIEESEGALIASGWRGTKLNAYDQNYYRKWSHEIPPLLYPGRLLSVDVHHTICPPVSRLRPNAEQFWAESVLSNEPEIRLLSPVDSVLHAAVHLFFDSDFDARFRDLIDLHELLTSFSIDQSFWPALLDRAHRQGLGRPLYYTLTTLQAVLRTPIPALVMRETEQFKPQQPVDLWMTRTLQRVLVPLDPALWPRPHGALLWLLYVRSHWLRMPAHLLIPHLLRKSWRRGALAVDP